MASKTAKELGTLLADSMTIRELFAAMAMQGMLADSRVDHTAPPEEVAESAVSFADCLLAALAKEADDGR